MCSYLDEVYLWQTQYFTYVHRCYLLVSSTTCFMCYMSLVLRMIVFYLTTNYLFCILLVLCTVFPLCEYMLYTCFVYHLCFVLHVTGVTCHIYYLFYVKYLPYVNKCCVLVSSTTCVSCSISLVLLMIVFYLEVNYLFCTLLVWCSVCHLRCNILVYKYTHDLRKSVSYTCFVYHLCFLCNTTCIN